MISNKSLEIENDGRKLDTTNPWSLSELTRQFVMKLEHEFSKRHFCATKGGDKGIFKLYGVCNISTIGQSSSLEKYKREEKKLQQRIC